MQTAQIFDFSEEEVKELMKRHKTKNPKEALELWAFTRFDMKHNASITLGEATETSVEVVDIP